jgi:phage terminase large subunit
MFERTTAATKLLKLKKRKRVIPGGTWAGKTYVILAIEISYLSKYPNNDTTVVAETIPAIKQGALKDFIDIMQELNRWQPHRMNYTDRLYTFANGSKIQFTAFDSEDKAKQAGKRKRLFVNEVNTVAKPIVDALMIRTEDVIWLDYNPTASFWVNDELSDDVDCDWLTLTYKDNEALPETILNELLKRREKAKTSAYWSNWCDVYLDGKIGSLEGVIFRDWKMINELPKDEKGNVIAKCLGYGMDFGYTNDPTTLIACYSFNGEYIFDEVIYQTGLLNNDICNLMRSKGVTLEGIYADSSEPKSIAEIRRNGFNIKGADKGKDSIMYGINLLQQQPFKVTESSVNLIKELRGYIWDKDKEGNKLNKPIDAMNHGIDAMRYFAVMKINTNRGIYDIR